MTWNDLQVILLKKKKQGSAQYVLHVTIYAK